MPIPNPLLYRSETGTVFIIDLPASISWAQSCCDRLVSTKAIQYPHQTPEPKNNKRDQLLANLSHAERQYHNTIESLVEEALWEATSANQDLPWLLPRAHALDALPKESLDDSCENKRGDRTTNASPPLVLSTFNQFEDLQSLTGCVVHNPFAESVELCVCGLERFRIPAQATFILSSISNGLRPFETAAHTLASPTTTLSKARILFDLIVLDPPWSNRSVRNGRNYRTAETQQSDPFVQTLPIISNSLVDGGYVAIWITNKSSLRRQVETAFQGLGLQLTAEWIWAKVTSTGLPTMPLNGVWRKPYEILLLFSSKHTTLALERKVIFGVPDVHSRKPNLKVLFEQILPLKYQALELFARSLTSGWWSWGDEVLKFQNERCWVSDK